MHVEVEKMNAHGLTNDKILCEVAPVADQGANVYRPTFTVPPEGFLMPVVGKENRFTVNVAEDGAQPIESKSIIVRVMSTDGTKAGASIRLHRAFVQGAMAPA